MYVRSSISQYAVGLLMFSGLLVNLDNIFRLLPEAYSGSAAVIILISFGNLVSGSAGVNGVVLATSSLYRFQTWLMFILIALFVVTSVILIPLWGDHRGGAGLNDIKYSLQYAWCVAYRQKVRHLALQYSAPENNAGGSCRNDSRVSHPADIPYSRHPDKESSCNCDICCRSMVLETLG